MTTVPADPLCAPASACPSCTSTQPLCRCLAGGRGVQHSPEVSCGQLCSFDWVCTATVQVGVVYNPILKELYTAMRGQGAFLNNQPIRVSEKKQLEQAMLGTELGISRDAETMVRQRSATAGNRAAGWEAAGASHS